MWFNWSGMKAKVPKCYSLSLKASTVKINDQKLTLYGQSIHFVGMKLLSVTVQIPLDYNTIENISLGDHA